MPFLIHEYLDTVTAQNPSRTAAIFLDQKLTYEQLTLRSNQLANILVEHNVNRHDRVGIFMDKGIETPVALYGIMKSGAAYVPLDPAAPIERIAAVIKDCRIRHLVTSNAKARKLHSIVGTSTKLDCVVGLDDLPASNCSCISWHDVACAAKALQFNRKIIESDLAYIIYTSGSTGKPKGIMHTHHSGISFSRWAVQEYGLNADDRLSNHAPLHFDLSVFDYFAAIVAGASTVIVPEEHTKLPASYTQLLADERVTVLFTVPFALIQMALRGSLEHRDLSALRWAIFGGEPMPPVYLQQLNERLPHVRFDNMYGPAEVNGCTHFTVENFDVDSIPIGPMANCAEALIVNADDTEVATGEIGELLVRTPTMMRGYWQREDLNKRAFYCRENEIGHMDVFYRTGDLVQESDRGVLRFVGRKDRQAKVRGYRIELDEIELAITSLDAVEESAVYLIDDEEGSKMICAEVTLCDASNTTPASIYKALKARLPWYAVPAEISVTPEFPRTQTGKIDRRRLREETIQARRNAQTASSNATAEGTNT